MFDKNVTKVFRLMILVVSSANCMYSEDSGGGASAFGCCQRCDDVNPETGYPHEYGDQRADGFGGGPVYPASTVHPYEYSAHYGGIVDPQPYGEVSPIGSVMGISQALATDPWLIAKILRDRQRHDQTSESESIRDSSEDDQWQGRAQADQVPGQGQAQADQVQVVSTKNAFQRSVRFIFSAFGLLKSTKKDKTLHSEPTYPDKGLIAPDTHVQIYSHSSIDARPHIPASILIKNLTEMHEDLIKDEGISKEPIKGHKTEEMKVFEQMLKYLMSKGFKREYTQEAKLLAQHLKENYHFYCQAFANFDIRQSQLEDGSLLVDWMNNLIKLMLHLNGYMIKPLT